MATTIKRLTYDDLESIPQEREGDRHEIIDGELVLTLADCAHEAVPAGEGGAVRSPVLSGLVLMPKAVFQNS
jgi:hypothetical protein